MTSPTSTSKWMRRRTSASRSWTWWSGVTSSRWSRCWWTCSATPSSTPRREATSESSANTLKVSPLLIRSTATYPPQMKRIRSKIELLSLSSSITRTRSLLAWREFSSSLRRTRLSFQWLTLELVWIRGSKRSFSRCSLILILSNKIRPRALVSPLTSLKWSWKQWVASLASWALRASVLNSLSVSL